MRITAGLGLAGHRWSLRVAHARERKPEPSNAPRPVAPPMPPARTTHEPTRVERLVRMSRPLVEGKQVERKVRTDLVQCPACERVERFVGRAHGLGLPLCRGSSLPLG